MFEIKKRQNCPYRVCTGKLLNDRRHCDLAAMCFACDHRIFNPCGTCVNYKDCDFKYKEEVVL